MVVISPHLDDAVFGCAHWLAARPGTLVVTVFAGPPADGSQRTEWDAKCGFSNAGEAVLQRREEDRAALSLLGAQAHWLPFADAQYGVGVAAHEISKALMPLLRDADAVVLPLGLFHSDHALAHQAAMHAMRASPPRELFAYEDALYRGLRGLLQQRLAVLAQEGITATPARVPVHDNPALKARAVQAYASQLRGFGPGGYDDLSWPERYWRLEMASHAR